jgi:hypothetical protein
LGNLLERGLPTHGADRDAQPLLIVEVDVAE